MRYIVSYCDDETRAAALDVPDVMTIQRPADCTPGAAFNHAATYAPGADIYFGFCDDVFPLTWEWDHYLALALQKPLICFCWQEMTDPANCSYIASSGRVLKALGDLCPEYFPFWFTDLWLAEIHHMAFGFRPPLVDGLRLAGKRGTTQGFRDFEFWCRLFAFTRPERIRLAHRLAAEYGTTPKDMPAALAVCRAFDADFLSKTERFSKRFADDQKPELFYVLAKKRAEAMMAQSDAA